MRITLGEVRRLVREAIGYHGSWQPDLTEVIPDPEGQRTLNGLGTWFTSSSEQAKRYGDNVYEADVPDGRYHEASTDDFSRFFYDLALARNRLSAADRPLVDAYIAGVQQPSNPVLRPRLLQLKRAGKNWQSEAREAIFKLFRDWDYLQAFRSKLQQQGFDGIVWRNSHIDASAEDGPHDVYLIFGSVKTKRKLMP